MRPKIRSDAVWGALALAAFVALSLVRGAQTAAPSGPSSYDTGRYGYRALHDLLAREGVSVGRFERNHRYLSSAPHCLIVAVSRSDASTQRIKPPSNNEIVAIKDWVKAGGHLIVLAPEFGDAQDALLGIPATHVRANVATHARPFANLPAARGVREVVGVYESEFAWDAAPKALPILVTSTGSVALQYRLGAGSVTAITDPGMFGNGQLARAQNARFAVQLVKLNAPSGVAFDETIHGYGQTRTLWASLPQPVHTGVYIAVFALLLGVAGNLVRFAPPLETPPLAERDSSAYITSMAHLLARARASRKALRDAADPALRGVRRALGATDRTHAAALAPRLQNQGQRNAVLELERLTDLERPSDAQLIRAGVLSAQLRKDFGL